MDQKSNYASKQADIDDVQADINMIVRCLDDHKGEDIKVYPQPLYRMWDYMIVVTARSRPHIKTLGVKVKEMLKGGVFDPGEYWSMLDYGCILMHVFDESTREYYQVDRLWGGKEEEETEAMEAMEATEAMQATEEMQCDSSMIAEDIE